MPAIDLEQLQRDVRYLKDRQDILDCVQRHARGHDRHDKALMLSAYHDDGVDQHGPFVNPATEYPDWANGVHEIAASMQMHHITTHNCEIDGDVAHAESYVIVGMLRRDGATATLTAGRYVDRLERRDGAWKIALRRTTAELSVTGDASVFKLPVMAGYAKGERGATDMSYARPLTLDTPSETW